MTENINLINLKPSDIFRGILKEIGLDPSGIDNVTIHGNDPILPSPFLIGNAGSAVQAVIGYLVSELWFLKNQRRQNISISARDAAIAQKSHQYLRIIDGLPQELWDPISGFYETKDNKWIQFHCNFPHHKAGVLTLLGCDDKKENVINATKTFDAEYLETTLSDRGMCAAMVRTEKEWESHPQYKAISHLPLVEIIKIGDSKPKPLPYGLRPLSGIKVLDLTRVIAGPVCGKTFAEHGAEVVLVNSPNLPNIPALVIDTGHGKKSLYCDLDNEADKHNLVTLIQKVDIFSQSYRPGALSARGLAANDLLSINPNIIYVSFSSYSDIGPWGTKHGFDTLVQSTSGIAYEQGGGRKPQHLPSQTLDYVTGWLGAIGSMEALRRRVVEGGAYEVKVSLVRTAKWLKSLGRCSEDFKNCIIPTHENIKDLLMQRDTDFGRIEYIKPILKMSETMPFWDLPTIPIGSTKFKDIWLPHNL
jgi:crotonobetainyl-CoA:carnitine CoA-transferase CaiB-like acyl-CoA transferase